MINIENIAYSLNNEHILNNINFQIQNGEIIGITGPGGCGKTALLKTLTGWLKPDNGSIKFDGMHLSELSKNETTKLISYYFSGLKFNPEATVYDEILDGRIHYKKFLNPYSDLDHESTIRLIRELELETYCEKRLKCLPHSIKQLCLIAKTFNADTDNYILDTPDSTLDVYQKFLTSRLFKKKVKKGNNIIIISSTNIDFLLKTCDRLIIIKNGSVIEAGGSEIITEKLIKDTFGLNSLISRNLVTGIPEVQIIDIN